ncbi:MAG: tRNA-dihydrouridine synthase [Nitrospirae bacterium]|nr:tRNA-dihydrouridine synthase [Nitrospirota bacterium]MBI3352160.1 tRNA-dihydrouridine synthase [Nitrospirota bacterium]
MNNKILKSKLPPTYQIDRSYETNYQEGPLFTGGIPKREISPSQNFMGFKVNSRFGVPAGPLLNARWIALYAKLGFDLLVYKTVRTSAHPAHPAPNCMVLNVFGQLEEQDFGHTLVAENPTPHPEEEERPVSITNSFGMPSRDPSVWQEDAEKAKAFLEAGQLFILSVVGTPQKGKDLAEDYARAAILAKEAGADIVEINLSCPNVTTGEGSIFTDPDASSTISKKVRQALKGTPLIIKMGYISDDQKLEKVILANAPYIEGISGINTLSFKVVKPDGSQALPGPGRLQSGVCGAAIRNCGLKQTERTVEIRNRHRLDFSVIGVGGIMTVEDILSYEKTGADASMSATGAMWDPLLAYKNWQASQSKIRHSLS